MASADLKEKLTQAGLEADYWAGILKSKLNITLPQQIQYLDETHLKELEGFVRHDWEKEALKNLLGIQIGLASSKEGKEGETSIVFKLNETGLDGEYWANALKSKLGVTKFKQIENLNAKDLEKLKSEVRYEWEENALRKLFCLNDEANEESMINLERKHKEIQVEAQNLLREVDELRKAGVQRTDDMMSSKLERLSQVMSIPKDQWIENYNDKSFDDMIDRLGSDVQGIIDREPIKSMAEILNNASGGLALRGVLVGEDFGNDCVKRVVLSPLTDVVHMNPVMQQVDDIATFSSKEQSDHFHQTLDTMGYSVAASVKGGRLGFAAEGGFSLGKEEEREVISEHHKHTHFESRVKYSVVPTASCQLNPHNLKLCAQALRDLKAIDRILVGSDNTEIVYKMSANFLSMYGSHINVGLLHFGGVYKFVGTYTSETESETDQVKSMVRDALGAYASAGYSALGSNIGGSVSADQLKTHANVTNDYKKSELKKTNLQTQKSGGPPEVSGLALWRMGLVSCNSTWALIDRGKSLCRDFVGLWRLISNHPDEFQKPYELQSALVSVWEKMSGYKESSHQERNLMQGLDLIDRLIEKITKWNSDQILPQQCVGYLKEIEEAISMAEAQTRTNKYWVEKLCTNENISSFLEKVVDLRDQLSPGDSSEIRLLMRKLVKPAGFRKFPSKEKIMKFAEVNAHRPIMDAFSVPHNSSIRSIPDLISNLEKKIIPELEHGREVHMNEQASSTNAAATSDFALCVRQLLRHLQLSKKTHEMFFLEVALLSLDYHQHTGVFGTLVTVEKVKKFTLSTEESWCKFQVHKEEGSVQLEGFLIHKLLTTTQFIEGQESSEEEFSKMVEELRQVLSPEVNKVLNTYATKSPFHWIDMKEALAELAKGNISVIEEKEANIAALEELHSSQHEHEEDDETINSADSTIAAEGDFKDILNILGLTCYYPSKISISDAIAIKKTIVHPELIDIPWMILYKLLMIDFHARDLPFSELNKSSMQYETEMKGEFDFEEALYGKENTGGVEAEAAGISTLDVMIALFACCDNILKQIVAQKLFVCKLAIPFMYPLGSKENFGMSLWALRTIILECHNKSNEPAETPVTNGSFPLVSFVRLGRPPMSKSKLLNNLLTDGKHDTFFHEDCDNGVVPRRITDGLVECSWFIPAGKEMEHLPEATMFLNLRGDASLMKKQLQTLQKISTAMFVLVSANDLAKSPNRETCQHLLQAHSKVILFVITNSGKRYRRELQGCYNAVGGDLLKGVPLILSNTRDGNQKNASELKTESRRKISDALEGGYGVLLEDCAKSAKEMGMIVDEYDDQSCMKGKELAEKAYSHLEGKKIEECRDSLLPLQGEEWIGYSKLLKMQNRAREKGSEQSSAYYADQMKQKMDRLRKKQLETCKNGLPPLIVDFISGLKMKEPIVMYFLKWLSLFLDEKTRCTLPGARREYYNSWNKFQLAKKDGDGENLKYCKLQVDNAERTLANASLGLENLFRELGQVYEAMKEGGKIGEETRLGGEDLAEIAAKLLLHGIPLELVDGDASNVPISWVCAVLSKVENLIGEKRLYVISVLGIQSSGKSTLLNTMFGLQFAVSAGRCTRGAYMQLIKVDKKAGLPFNYLAVVDTEGLRAPELGQLKYEHDNELATLVVGLGDVTLINIKGENTSEIKDILQIAVHAFLRMNLVKRHIRDNRTCMFVHQNVPAANADELMRHGCQKLKEGLDDRAKEAALSESRSDIHSFSQIINFNIERHVWYISDLWQGNPPMAPANPGYSEKINEVKLSLLGEIAQGKTYLMASELSIRLGDLWKGVLADDFVFSFRNSLEVKAYNSLQSEYYTLEWELQTECKSWLHDAEIKLKRCETLKALDSCYQTLLTDLRKIMITKADEIRARLESYFESSDLRDIIIQWQQSKINQLQFADEEQQREGRKDLLSIKETRRVEILHLQKYPKHESYIMKKAVELANELKGKEASDAELDERFDRMWVPLVDELAPETDDKELKVDIVMEEILKQRIHDHRSFLSEELRQHPLHIPPDKQVLLESSITPDFVKKDHISVKTKMFETFRRAFRSTDPEEEARHNTVVLTGSILKEISSDLRGLTHDMKFQKSYAKEIINKLVDKLDYHNQLAKKSDKIKFTILPDYIVKLAVHVSRYCVQFFSLMQFEYNKKHGMKAKLEAYRAKAWILFKNKVKDATEEVLACDILCTHLKDIVQDAVKRATPRKCTEEILGGLQRSKYYMLQRIMDDLADNGNFKEYKSFINDAKEFASEWLTRHTDVKMFTRQNPSNMSRYTEITKSHIGVIMRCIQESISHATSEVEGQGGMKMALWIEKFCDRVSEQIAVRASDLSFVSERSVVDFNNFQKVVLDQLDKVQADLENAFSNTSQISVDWDGPTLPQQVLDKIWGCPEQCPFCHEPCADTTPNHVQLSGKSHMCVQHRPDGMAGIRWKKDGVVNGDRHSEGELSFHSCNYSVQLESVTFSCSACRNRCRDSGKCSATGTDKAYHKYVEYKTFLPHWDIAPDRTNSVSKYWTWVMATYQHQLKDWHKAKSIDIPESWRSVSKAEALEDLRKIHH